MKNNCYIFVRKKIVESILLKFREKKIVSQVYEYVPRGAEYPFVQIGETLVQDNSTKTSEGKILNIRVIIYDQAKSSAKLVELSELVMDAVKIIDSEEYYIRIQFINSELKQKGDGQTTTLNMKYKIIIMEKK